ncbi:hypothetical protein BGX33_011408 [Mortierella sp. NVP41]|nr:hypothetical protein BGX33_011408 [Mortierella sp. NVP41]
MGIGSNPTIQCTPASDDEDNGDDEHIDRLSVDRYPVQDHRDEKEKQEFEQGGDSVGMHRGLRESTQSYGSQSSHILDYYKSSYLPTSLKSPGQNDSDNSERGLGSISEDDGQEFTVDRLGLLFPMPIPTVRGSSLPI